MTYRINIYGDITPDDSGVTAAWVSQELELADGQDIDLHIQSGGGDVFEGVAIMNILRDHPAEVIAVVEGLAASSASFIAIGGADKVIMQPSASLMIHEAWSGAMGSAREIAKTVAELDRMTNIIAQVYAEKAGTPVEEWLEAMAEESWFSSDEAVLVGLADEVRSTAKQPVPLVGASRVLNSSSVRWTNRDQAPTPTIVEKRRSHNAVEEEEMSFKNIAEALGTDEASVKNALQTLIQNQVVETTVTADVTYPEDVTIRPTETVKVEPVITDENGEPTTVAGTEFTIVSAEEGYTAEVDEHGVVSVTAPAVEPDNTAAFVVGVGGAEVPLNLTVVAVTQEPTEPNTDPEGGAPEGAISLDRDTYNEMKAAAQFGWEAMENKKKADQAAEVEQWINEGRISAGLRNKALSAMTTSPEIARDLYGSNPANSVPRNTLGHSQTLPASDSKVQELIAKANNLSGRK